MLDREQRGKRQVNTSTNLYQLIRDLEKAEVRLPDNSAYKADEETLGVLFAHLVSEVNAEYSPGLMLSKDKTISGTALDGFKKLFQTRARLFFLGLAGEQSWRGKTAEQWREDYFPKKMPDAFARNTIEYLVAQLVQQGQFATIGKCLQEGALKYHREATSRGMRNYRYSAEYDAIFHALQQHFPK